MYVMTDACGSLRFSAILSASHSGAFPPIVVKTRGLNEDFIMSITLGCTYPSSRFHVFGRSLLGTSQNKTVMGEVGCVILMSKNVFSHLFHRPLAEISNLALSAVLTFLS